MSEESAWGDITQRSMNLLVWLDEIQPSASEAERNSPCEAAPPLRLQNHLSPMTVDLEACGLSFKPSKRLSDMYLDTFQRLALELQHELDTHWAKLCEGCTSVTMELTSQTKVALVRMYEKHFLEKALSARLCLIRMAEAKTSRTVNEQFSESGEYTEETLVLLDEAWERCQKPSQGDRRKLAAVTGLSMAQVGQWFNNRRQRQNKPYSRPGRAAKPRSTRPTIRKVSSASSCVLSIDSTPSISLGSSTSSRDSSGEWDHSPAQSFAVAPAPFDSSSIDRYLQGIRTPSPSPSNGQAVDFFSSPYLSNGEGSSSMDFTSSFMTDIASTSQEDLSAYFPSQPQFSFTQPTPQPTQTSFHPVNLTMPSSTLSNPSLETDVAAGIDEDFWQRIMQAAGMADTGNNSVGDVSQDNESQSLSIAPAGEADWSFFGDMDFSAFGLGGAGQI